MERQLHLSRKTGMKLKGMIARPKLGETVESEEDNEEQGEDDDDGDEMSD